MSAFLAGLNIFIVSLTLSFNAGEFYGRIDAIEETRNQTVVYCNERPSACKRIRSSQNYTRS
jgi:hypothetical protein